MKFTGPSITPTDIWRRLEGYTLTGGFADSNADTYVDVLTVVGRGILVSAGFIGELQAANNENCIINVSIDGVNRITGQEIARDPGSDIGMAVSVPLLIGFSTGCIVSFRLSALGVNNMRYHAVALVE